MNSTNMSEPKEAFHYKPPDKKIRQQYKHIFNLGNPLAQRTAKIIFDKLAAALVLFIIIPRNIQHFRE